MVTNPKQFFHDLFENNPQGYIVRDEEGQIVYANVKALEYRQATFQALDSALNKLSVDFFHTQDSNISLDGRRYQITVITPRKDLLYENFFKRSPQAILLVNQEGTILLANDRMEKILNLSLTEIIGKTFQEMIFLNEGQLKTHLEKVFSGEEVHFTTMRRSKRNRLLTLKFTGLPYHQNGQIIGAAFFCEDITSHVNNQESLNLFKQIIMNYRDGVIVTNKDREIIWVNQSFTRITGYTFFEVMGKNPNILKSGLQGADFYKRMWAQISAKGYWSGQIWNKAKNQINYPQWIDLFTIKDYKGEVKYYVSIFKNLNDVEAINQKMLLVLQQDPLTTLYNRTSFIEVAGNLTDKIEGGYLLFLDINNYKPINDEYGHDVGDRVLFRYAESLLFQFRNQIIARYGGDEFLVFIKDNISREELVKLIDTFNPVISVNGEDFTLNTSFGIVEIPRDGRNINKLIFRADQAMYIAKKSHQRYFFYADMNL